MKHKTTTEEMTISKSIKDLENILAYTDLEGTEEQTLGNLHDLLKYIQKNKEIDSKKAYEIIQKDKYIAE